MDEVTEKIEVRVTPAAKRIIFDLAEMRGISASDFVREALIEYLAKFSIQTDLGSLRWGGKRLTLPKE